MPVAVKFKMLPDCRDLAPRKAHPDDAAYDLRSRTDMLLEPRTTSLIPTGLFLEIPPGYEAQIRSRSGLALKHGLSLPNAPGTIDAGYRGEVGVIMYNRGDEPIEIRRGDRIAQMVIAKLPEVELVESETLARSERGNGGFGSTGRG